MNYFWKEVEEIFALKGCRGAIRLNSGASESQLDELEKYLDVELPRILREILAVHNGQESGFGLIFGLQLLSVNNIRSSWDLWRSLEKDGLNEDLADSMSSQPNRVVKSMYSNPKWIPLTHDFGGNHIGIDYDPDIEGRLGQIITFGRDDDEKKLKANSLEEFLNLFTNQLRSVNWDISSKGWRIYGELCDRHYHDWNMF